MTRPKPANRAPGAGPQILYEEWLLAPDPDNVGAVEGWAETPPQRARPARVPGVIQQVYPNYHGVAWYWRRFTGHRTRQAGKRVMIRFGAVDYMSDVYLNGRLIGSHEGGEASFEFDVTGLLRHGEENLLAVRVLNPTDDPIDDIRLAETPHSFKKNTCRENEDVICGIGCTVRPRTTWTMQQ